VGGWNRGEPGVLLAGVVGQKAGWCTLNPAVPRGGTEKRRARVVYSYALRAVVCGLWARASCDGRRVCRWLLPCRALDSFERTRACGLVSRVTRLATWAVRSGIKGSKHFFSEKDKEAGEEVSRASKHLWIVQGKRQVQKLGQHHAK
jgi:hypothetical protein